MTEMHWIKYSKLLGFIYSFWNHWYYLNYYEPNIQTSNLSTHKHLHAQNSLHHFHRHFNAQTTILQFFDNIHHKQSETFTCTDIHIHGICHTKIRVCNVQNTKLYINTIYTPSFSTKVHQYHNTKHKCKL